MYPPFDKSHVSFVINPHWDTARLTGDVWQYPSYQGSLSTALDDRVYESPLLSLCQSVLSLVSPNHIPVKTAEEAHIVAK